MALKFILAALRYRVLQHQLLQVIHLNFSTSANKCMDRFTYVHKHGTEAPVFGGMSFTRDLFPVSTIFSGSNHGQITSTMWNSVFITSKTSACFQGREGVGKNRDLSSHCFGGPLAEYMKRREIHLPTSQTPKTFLQFQGCKTLHQWGWSLRSLQGGMQWLIKHEEQQGPGWSNHRGSCAAPEREAPLGHSTGRVCCAWQSSLEGPAAASKKHRRTCKIHPWKLQWAGGGGMEK